MKSIHKILVANRGEIAVRIIRTVLALGYETVAIYSDADANAPHVQMADQAVRIGQAEVTQSYLNAERILAAAAQTQADALHPGYGFLSENPRFAQQVIEAGLTWIGPPPAAMKIMSSKAAAKAALSNSSVPLIPGYAGDDQSDTAFQSAAEGIGYPIMVKAVAGGGGRGMRLIESQAGLLAALSSARSEALKAFDSEQLLLEKAIVNARHIEIQIFGDTHGNIIHLGERDCSVQRRHQKVIEEAPAPVMSPERRAQMGAAAVAVARAVEYVGAGTVEFLLDENDKFYFIEMNTRLQVEHPVTELVTGIDLVAWQLRIAEGKPLPIKQDDLILSGHAIEARLYAEDPEQQFLPSVGPVLLWEPPAGSHIRVDHTLHSGQEITPFYDPMIAKIIAGGETRSVARRRLQRALRQTVLLGVVTNRRFLMDVLRRQEFEKGIATTGLVERMNEEMEGEDRPVSTKLQAIAALLHCRNCQTQQQRDPNWRSLPYACQFDTQLITVQPTSPNAYEVQVGSDTFALLCDQKEAHRLIVECNHLREPVTFYFAPDGPLWLQVREETGSFSDSLMQPPATNDTAATGRITAPMPGAVMRIDATVGQAVKRGEAMLVLEAMKMEHTITAPFDGFVESLHIEAGQQMKPKELMIVVIKAEP